MTRTTWVVAIWEFRRFFKLRDQVIGLFLLILIGGGVGGLVHYFGGGEEDSPGPQRARLVIFPESVEIAKVLAEVPGLDLLPVAGRSEGELRAAVAEKSLDGLLLAPAGEPVRGVAREDSPWWGWAVGSALTRWRQQKALQEKGWPHELIEQFLHSTPLAIEKVAGKKGQAHANARTEGQEPSTGPDNSSSSEEKARASSASILVGLMLYAVFVSLSFFFVGVTGEKRDRVTEQVVAAVSPQTWIDGKLLGITLAALGSTLVFAFGLLCVFMGVKIIFKGDWSLPYLGLGPVEVVLFLTSSVLGLLMWNCFFAALTATINDPNSSARSSLLFLALVPVILVWMVTDRPDDAAMRVMMLIPLTAPAALPARYLAGTPAVWEIALALALLGLTIWVFRHAAGKIFAVGILMYGKEPNMREIWRWVRSV